MQVEYDENGLACSLTVWPPTAGDIASEKRRRAREAIRKMSDLKLRAATESQMTCCGQPVALTGMGPVCSNLDCPGPRTKMVEVLGVGLGDDYLAAIWPERVVKHDKPLRSRLKSVSDGLKRIRELEQQRPC